MFATFSSSLSDRAWAANEGEDADWGVGFILLETAADGGGVAGADCWTWVDKNVDFNIWKKSLVQKKVSNLSEILILEISLLGPK